VGAAAGGANEQTPNGASGQAASATVLFIAIPAKY